MWGNLIERAKRLVKREPARPLYSVRRMAMDEIVYRDVCADTPALGAMADQLNEEHSFTGELVQDTFQLFFKALPELLSKDAVDPRVLINHAVITGIQNDPTTTNIRELTRTDRHGAALATLAMHDRIESDLTRSDEAEACREATQQAADAEQHADDLGQVAADLADRLQQAGAPDGVGPLTEQQQALADDLQRTLDQQEQAVADAEQARADAEKSVQQLASRVRPGVREALRRAEEQLERERTLINAFGLDEGKLARMSFEERQRFMRRLSNSKMGRFAHLLGRYRLRAQAERARKVRFGRDEVYDVTLGADLPDVLPAEFTKLAVRATRLMFLRDFAEKRLLQRAWRGVERVAQGPVVALFDGSSSMKEKDRDGIPRETWAKAFGLSMLDQAQAGKRDFVAINFAGPTKQKVWFFPGDKRPDIDAVMEWTEHLFTGGTSYEVPIDLGVKVIAEQYDTEGKGKADLLIVTDDECQVSPDWLAKYQRAKRYLGFRTYGVAVGDDKGYGVLDLICDDTRRVTEFADPSVVVDIYQSV